MSMRIERPHYLNQLIAKRENGRIKVITGVRRSGKSFLLSEIYHPYLISEGVGRDCIINLSLEEMANIRYRNPIELDRYLRAQIADSTKQYYIFLDEIQKVIDIRNPYVEDSDEKVGFVDVLLGLMKEKNVDLYVTGSNSRLLSSDILTEFRGRGDEVRVNPLTFSEFYAAYTGEKTKAWQEYCTYGGMPYLMSLADHREKSQYLKDLLSQTYLSDILDRYRIYSDQAVLEDLLDIVASSVGSLTNPTKLANTFRSVKKSSVTATTVSRYLDYFVDSFLLVRAHRYDIKGKRYIETPLKYYYTDVGLRNAKLGFRQQEENHIMENVIFNELMARGFDVDVGVVECHRREADGKKVRVPLEVDFVANQGSRRYYIQSALTVAEEDKRRQEIQSLLGVPDSFKKIVVVRDAILPWHDENGILYLGVEQLLLDETALDL